MQQQRFQDKVVVVTGGGSGIGKALAEAFAKEGARVVVADLSHQHTEDVAQQVGGMAFTCDVTNPAMVRKMIQTVRQKWGRIDIYCSNAGIMIPPTLQDVSNDHIARLSDKQWDRVFQVNAQSHVIAARELIANKETWDGGIFVMTASAAGLLAIIEDACHGVSKAAAVSFAEHLAIIHPQIQVHCLCPQSVDTPFIPDKFKQILNSATMDGLVTPPYVAECTLNAIHNNSFWIFPHEKVPQYVQFKVMQHERWLKGMHRLRERLRRAQSKL